MSTQVKSRRKRPSLVCCHCKSKKIKCDKGNPCSQCVKSKLADTCSYTSLDATRNDYERFRVDKPYLQSAKNPIEIKIAKTHKDPSKTSPPKHPNESVVVAKSELQFLKDRLMQIEASLSKSKGLSSDVDSKSTSPPELEPTQPQVNTPRVPQNFYNFLAGTNGSMNYIGQPPQQYTQRGLNLGGSPPPAMFQGDARRMSVSGITPSSSNTYPSPHDIPSTPYNVNIQLPPLRWRQQQQLQEQQQQQQQHQQFLQQLQPQPQLPTQQVQPTPTIRPHSKNGLYLSSSSYSTSIPKDSNSSSSATSASSTGSPFILKEADSPNGSGQKYNIQDLCLVTELGQIKGINPYLDTEERINLFEKYTSIHVKEPTRRITYGPFAWSSLMKRDDGLRMLWDYMIKKKESSKESNATFVFAEQSSEITKVNTDVLAGESKEEGPNNVENAFHRRALEPDGLGDVLPYNSLLKLQKEKEEAEEGKQNGSKTSMNIAESTAAAARTASLLQLGLTTKGGKLGRELALIDKIQLILPKKRVIWKLLDRYFTWLYPFMPFLDHECFMLNIHEIMGPKSYEDVSIGPIRIEKRLDLGYVGILLVVLRLAYLSLFSNKLSVNPEKMFTDNSSIKAEDMKYLYSNPINIDVVEVAQLCLDQFQIFRSTSLTILQLAIFLRIYHTFAPEDGDGADGGDSQVFGAMLIQMAYSLGLHREPDNFPDVCNNPKINHLGRKIFHFLCIYDIHQSFSFGNPLSIDVRYYDVKLPFFDKDATNIPDASFDKTVTEQLAKCWSTYSIIPILHKLLNAKDGCNVSEVCKQLEVFELDMIQLHGTAKDCFDQPLASDTHRQFYLRNFLTKFYLSINAFFMTVYFHFYLYYEQKSEDLSFYYLKKMLLITTGETMPHYFDLLGNKEYICDMIINPTLEQFIHKANQLNIALLVRVNFILYHYSRQNDHMQKYETDANYHQIINDIAVVSRLLKRSVEISISAISKLSNRYYYAWRVTKGHTYLLKTVNDIKFYEENYSKAGNLCFPIYTPEQIKLFITIMKKSVEKFDYVEELVPDFCPCLSLPESLIEPKRSMAPVCTSDYRAPDFDKDFVNDEDIDLLWFQMISKKYDNNLNQDPYTAALQYQDPNQFGNYSSNSNEPIGNFNNTTWMNTGVMSNKNETYLNSNSGNGRGDNRNNNDNNLNGNKGTSKTTGVNYDVRHGFDLEEMARFDIFNDLPFDQVFAKNLPN